MKKVFRLICLIIVVLVVILFFFEKKYIMKKVYPIKYYDIVEKYSNEYNVDKYLIFATIKAESNFREKAVSKKGAKGLMQLIDSTAKEVASGMNLEITEEDILNPEININLGTRYISTLIKKYKNLELALAAYNAGSGNVDNWVKNNVLKEDGSDWENIPYKETKSYVRKILMDYEIYKKIYQEEG